MIKPGFLFVCAIIPFSPIRAETPQDLEVPEITVMGETQKSSSVLDFVPTVSELSGTRLNRKKQSTLGETLSRETGVTSSQFGPNSSRPVIRGLEGDRIRILENNTGLLDASTASPDHAVAIDPLNVERVEIVRGPSALLYGSSAVGGVVNMVTNRIPEKMPENSKGKAETRFSSVDLGRSAGFGVDTRAGNNWAIHADLSARGSDDYKVPGFARSRDERSAEPLDPEESGRVYNSFNRSQSGALGASYIFDQGFLGASFSNYLSNYGTVAEREVLIEMSKQRWDFSSEVKTSGFIQSARIRNSYSLYAHDEIEEGVLATEFENDGNETRVDLSHQGLIGKSGLMGAQVNLFKFGAKGDEAFLPSTNNKSYSLFLFEEFGGEKLKPSLGARFDHSSVQSDEDTNFGPSQTKSFNGGSLSLGLLYQFLPKDSIVLNASSTQRAPNYQELFANGRHIVTGQFEQGDTDLGLEKSQAIELSWRHKEEDSQGSVGLFLQDFKNFIALLPSGGDDGDPDEPFEIYSYSAVGARLYGAEVDYRITLPQILSTGVLELEFKADMVKGINRSSGDHLPRMTPVRESIALFYKTNRFQADIEAQRSEKQTLTAPGETRTKDFTLVHVGVESPLKLEWAHLSLFGRVNNVFDVKARNHVSLVKDLAPLPGRSFVAGMQASF